MDTLGNLLTKIRNAFMARHEEVTAPASKLTVSVLQVLAKEGYISKVTTEESSRPTVRFRLEYKDKTPSIERVRRISRPGRRVYVPADRIPRPIGGFGTILLSTPAGILTGNQATKQRLGGEVLCEIIRG